MKTNKRKAGNDSKYEFIEKQQNKFLFIVSPSGKPLCVVCEKYFST